MSAYPTNANFSTSPNSDPSKNVIFYSYCARTPETTNRRTKELLTSIETLRKHNKQIPVYVYTYDHGLRGAIVESLKKNDVQMVHVGWYRDIMEELLPGSGSALEDYPVLHKHFSSSRLPAAVERAVYVDNDTVWGKDAAELFSSAYFKEGDVWAREDSSFSGPDWKYWHLEYQKFLYQMGVWSNNYIVPFNSGVILYNNRSWNKVDLSFFLQVLLRFSMYIISNELQYLPLSNHSAGKSSKPFQYMRDHMPEMVARFGTPLTYPCKEPWIREQVAICVAMTAAALRWRLFPHEAVCQGCEEWQVLTGHVSGINLPPIVSHYFTPCSARFFELIYPSVYLSLGVKPFDSKKPQQAIRHSRNMSHTGTVGPLDPVDSPQTLPLINYRRGLSQPSSHRRQRATIGGDRSTTHGRTTNEFSDIAIGMTMFENSGGLWRNHVEACSTSLRSNQNMKEKIEFTPSINNNVWGFEEKKADVRIVNEAKNELRGI